MSSGVLFASTNKGKCGEVKEKALEVHLRVSSATEIREALKLGEPPEVVEDADTYVGNARLKAEGYYSWAQMPSLADDSGLEVAALGGEPGLYTARYAGPGCTPADNIEKLLGAMSGCDNRIATFRCALSLCISPGHFIEVEADLPGRIVESAQGEGGFGYDPVFIPDGYEDTLAVLKHRGEDIKTHRTKALDLLFQKIREENLSL